MRLVPQSSLSEFPTSQTSASADITKKEMSGRIGNVRNELRHRKFNEKGGERTNT